MRRLWFLAAKPGTFDCVLRDIPRSRESSIYANHCRLRCTTSSWLTISSRATAASARSSFAFRYNSVMSCSGSIGSGKRSRMSNTSCLLMASLHADGVRCTGIQYKSAVGGSQDTGVPQWRKTFQCRPYPALPLGVDLIAAIDCRRWSRISPLAMDRSSALSSPSPRPLGDHRARRGPGGGLSAVRLSAPPAPAD